MAQVITTESPNEWCKLTLNSGKPDVCLLASCQICPPKLPLTVSPMLNCRINSLFAQGGSMCPNRGPVHSHPLSHNSRIMVQPTFVIRPKNFNACFPNQFGHGYEKGPSFEVPEQWLFEGEWTMLGEDNKVVKSC